jgi:hypothetical protein
MYGGLTAKERLAQLQQKSGTKDPPPKAGVPLKKVGKINGAAEKPKEEAKPASAAAAKQPEVAKPKAVEVAATKDEPKKVETKPAEEPKKAEEKVQPQAAKPDTTDAKEPVKPKVEEKPKEEPKQPEVKVEPPKATEESKVAEVKKQPEPTEEAAKPPEQKPKGEPKKVESAKELKPKEEPSNVEIKEAAKAPEEIKAPAAKEPPKPVAEEPKKPEPKVEPSKPKEQEQKEIPKPAEAKPTETKPAETAKKEPEKTADAKPIEAAKKEPEKPVETKPADKVPAPAPKEPEKPKEVPKKPEPPAPAAVVKPKEEPPKPQPNAAEKLKADDKKTTAAPKAEPPKPSAEAAKKPAEPAKPVEAKPAEKPKEEPKKEPEVAVKKPPPTTDAMIGTIFYFSGMGSLLGSALAEGVYVPERNQRTALDADMVEAALESTKAKKREEIVVTARNQAQILSTDFRHLQALLESLPTFGEPLESKPLDRRAVDQPIHGHVYFQQRQQQQQQIVDGEHYPNGDAAADIALLQPLPTRETKRAASGASVEAPISVSYTSSVYRSPPVAPASTIVLVDQKYPFAVGASSTGRQPEIIQPPREARPFNPERVQQQQQQQQQPQQHQLITSTQAWQDHYGQEGRVAPQPDPAATTGARSPRPFNAAASAGGGGSGGDRGSVDASGIKPWQLSHVRALEAKGYRLVSDHDDRQQEPAVASDGRSSATASFSPYLVSDRTLNVDRQKTFQRGMMESPTVGSTQPFRPTSAGAAYPFAPAVENTMPYCDL